MFFFFLNLTVEFFHKPISQFCRFSGVHLHFSYFVACVLIPGADLGGGGACARGRGFPSSGI